MDAKHRLASVLRRDVRQLPSDSTMAEDLAREELVEMANLSERQTGIPGTLWISTRMARHGPRVKYFPRRPGEDKPSFSVSIPENGDPEVVANSLPLATMRKTSPLVIAWVKLNQPALLRFWMKGNTWMDEEVTAFKAALRRIEPS